MFEALATIMAMSGALFIFSLFGGKNKTASRTARKAKISRKKVVKKKK